MRFALTLMMAALAPSAACSRATDADAEQEVMEPIHAMFRAMEIGDSSLARSVFHYDARLVRLPDSIVDFRVDTATVDRFLASIGGERDESWEEPIWDWEVRIDNNLASVWTKYAFYRDGTFSHCGVDAFLMSRVPEGWKILSLVYSRRQEGCVLPDGVELAEDGA